ncbi:4-(cytidine 5'-diphospho)-2-C-methyl-D-erythritol kinase [Oleomonas cavernae]|uniref:4-diphosphocytidyl-2-C-methyl-D-erythritol kinase n=1 Tax=Oleomonas cavernae TaxID=2320859 RepID=A0A418WIW8_9PROT|nr:4-(cytidine 5'-diphospho)-2-C-methyl-D-erythritol kinase [Oleomonas cavernae]
MEAAAASREAAPAKLNLYLHVTGRRPDGYHLLESLVAFADIGDVITAVAAPPGVLDLTTTGPFATAIDGPAQDNLVLRAARGMVAAVGGGQGARLTLDKRLPVASGLGGGSADAAAAIRALEALWHRRVPAADRQVLAVALGADVPVCLSGQAAHMAGIGEVVTPLATAVPTLGLVLVNAGVALSTPAVFAALAGRFGPADRLDPVPADADSFVAALRRRRNDLQAPAMALCPAVAQVLDLLATTPEIRLARMSGSGATCYGLYPDRAAAAAAAGAISAARPDWWVRDGALSGGQGAPRA